MKNSNKPSMADTYKYMFQREKLRWAKYGGKICTIAGTTGLFLTGLHASRKTYLIHDELKENGERIRKAMESGKNEKKITRAMRVIREVGKATLHSGKHYIPDIIGGGISAYTNAKGWQHEHNNYKQAATMAGVLAASFMNYRMNVIAEEGKEADLRYFNTKHVKDNVEEVKLSDGTKLTKGEDKENSDTIVVQLNPDDLRIRYSKTSTPSVWSESHAMRIANLNRIAERLRVTLVNRGNISVNDVRREFFNDKGDVACGGMWGRIWDPGNPEHPERGRFVNLHFEDDEDFMSGIKDWCWIEIEIDTEPLFESMAIKKKRDQDKGYFPPVEPVY